MEAALRTAAAIGDDTLQRKAQGYVVPDSFTHGSAQQRQRWFARRDDQRQVLIESLDADGYTVRVRIDGNVTMADVKAEKRRPK